MIEQWYTAYAGELTRYVRSRGFTPEDAEDIVAQVFLEAVSRQPDDIAPRAWLYSVARSRLIDLHRAQSRRPAAPLEERHAIAPELDVTESISRQALLLLTLPQQRVIEARFLADRTISEVASDLGVTPETVKALQFRGIERLRAVTARPSPPRYSIPHERNWTADEEARLRIGIEHGWSDATIGGWLGRSPTAVLVRASRLQLSRRTPTTGSAREVATALGVGCAKSVTRWAMLGWLPVQRSSDQAGAKWRFLWSDVWAFLEKPEYWMVWHPERIADPARRSWALALRANKPQWLTPGEVARRYHVFGKAVNDWISRHGLQATRYGNWWINEKDLEGWVPPGERPRASSRRGVRKVRPRLSKDERQPPIGPYDPPELKSHKRGPRVRRYPASRPPVWATENGL